MSFSDDELMSYVDGELDAATRASIDAAAAKDPALAARLARQRALRLAVHAAYQPVLEEPMPKRLLDLARGAASDLPRGEAPPRRWTWFEWSAMAASVAIGIVAGAALPDIGRRDSHVAEASANIVPDRSGVLARGPLARALSEQLASTQAADAPVRVGLSFVSTAGEYCRTFALEQGGAARLGGLACRSGGEWRLPVIAQDESRGTVGYGRAAGAIPPPVLRAVEERIQGGALDAGAERAAQQRGWAR